MEIENIDINTLSAHQQIDLSEIISNIKKIKITSDTREELNSSIKLLRKFKLYESSKWCSELLLSINMDQSSQNQNSNSSPNNTSQIIQAKNLTNIFNKAASASSMISGGGAGTPGGVRKNYLSNSSKISPFNSNNNGADIYNIDNKYNNLYEEYKINEKEIKETLNYANTLFDLKEFLKCINVLTPLINPKYPRAMFLYYYSKYYLVSEKMQEEKLNNNENIALKYASPDQLNKLQIELSRYIENFSPFLNYLYGIILKDLKKYEESKIYFIKALNSCPFIWSCWIDLCFVLKQIGSKNSFNQINDHWMKYFYLENYFIEKNYDTEAIQILDLLQNYFPNNSFIQNQLAICYYNLHEYELSIEYFEKLFQLDPLRYEGIDIYSNILFIKENYCELSNLAYRCYENNKYRPETCCVIGNFYALKGEHPKAIAFFKRALKLDNNYLPVYTLMGHEFLEMKIISSAVESYRTAIDIDPNDFRAYYGLASVYEISQMYNFALYYYMKAAKSKSNDSRMFTALGMTYEKLDKKQEAIKCYEKAIIFKDKEGIALYRMAKLYDEMGDRDKAAVCFEQNLTKNVEGNIDGEAMIESCLYLSKYYKEKTMYDKAYNILMKLKDYEGSEKDEIHSLLKEINNLRSNNNNEYMDLNIK